MAKKYQINPTKKQLAIIKLYWDMFQTEQAILWGKMAEFEKGMSRETGIKDLEFFWCDNECVGVGNVSRTMRLIQNLR